MKGYYRELENTIGKHQTDLTNKKLAKEKNRRIFLVRCKNSEVVPTFLKLKKVYNFKNNQNVRHFDWDMKIQSYVLSSTYYGFLLTQLLGGYLSARFGGKLVFAIGVVGVSILTLLTPIAAKTNVYLLIVVCLFKGVFAGPLFPCANDIFAKWAPTSEKSRLVTIGFSGAYAGTLVSFPISSMLATYLGWESVFYAFGVFGCLWTMFWLIIFSDTPSLDSKISKLELIYITENVDETEKEKLIVPWIKIFTSVPVWALAIVVGCKAWGFFVLLSHLPTFVKHCLNYDLKEAGFVSAAPYLAMVIWLQFAGHLSDFMETRNLLTRTRLRKLILSVGLLIQCVFMALVVHWLSVFGSNFCLIMSVGLGGFAMAVITVNPLDLSPKYGSTIGGMIHTCGTISAILSPTVTGFIVTEQTDVKQWRVVFYIGSLIYILGAVTFTVFGSGELQPWDRNENQKKETSVNIRNSDKYIQKDFDTIDLRI